MKISKGQIWQGKIFDDVFLHIVSVDESKNTVKAVANDDSKVLSYRYDTFKEYYQLTENVFTRVVFKWEECQTSVIAFLLDFPLSVRAGSVLCYAHVGQHTEAVLSYARKCKPVKNPEDYQALKTELESIGYFVKPVRKLS